MSCKPNHHVYRILDSVCVCGQMHVQGETAYIELRKQDEINRIVNQPGMTWKERHFQLRCLLGNQDALIEKLVPRPPEGMDYWPSDY